MSCEAAENEPLRVTCTSDSNGTGVGNLQYSWNFGDGTSVDCCNNRLVTHVYANRSRYPVVLTVIDENSTTAQATFTILAGNPRPKAVLNVPRFVLKNELVHLDGSQSTDPDGPGHVVKWSFDSGFPGPDTKHDGPEDKWPFRYTSTGTYTAKLVVYDRDEERSINTASQPVDVVENFAPPAVAITSPQDGDDVRATITLRATVSSSFPISQVEFYVDQRRVASTEVLPPSAAWNSATFPDGTYTLTARAYNSGNGVGISRPVVVRVQNLQPQ